MIYTIVIQNIVDRNKIFNLKVDDVILGCVNQAGGIIVMWRNVPLLAGLPEVQV